MNYQKISACYFPTTVILVDDDSNYLFTVNAFLSKHLIPCKTFNNPNEAEQFFLKEYQPDYFTNRSVFYLEEENINYRNIEININSICKECYKPNRFDHIAVLVVDQEMPGLKGLELCERLKTNAIKKILLTGEVNNEDAIKAFNEGKIDKFINKNNSNFVETLVAATRELQHFYFNDLSSLILNSISGDTKYHFFSCLQDKKFNKFFNKLCEKKKIVEYYLLDEQGSFLFVDFDGNLSLLVVKDEDAMESTLFNAEVADQIPLKSTMQSLKNREKILYLASSDENEIAPADWESQGKLHPAKKLIGSQQTYYYSYITDLKSYDFKSEKVVSFKDYLEKLY